MRGNLAITPTEINGKLAVARIVAPKEHVKQDLTVLL